MWGAGPQQAPRRPYDFVLVSEKDEEDVEKTQKEKAFIKELNKKKIHVVVSFPEILK